MNLTTKNDLVIAALRKLGIASDTTLTDIEPQSTEGAVNDLEMMMAEWLDGCGETPGINVGYLFATDGESPDPGDEHGVASGRLSAIIHNLACRIAPDYKIEPSAKVVSTARYGKEHLIKLSAMSRARHAKNQAGYPSRMPVGSGNHLASANGWRWFHRRTPGDDGSE
ncbi:packaged DNA stabilization gp4 family protein [Pluralibacter gergoviae]|uniref:packaged DNA stabilization gp4 family protein n=1 Tax=Pluralibacter gergoviae TaxID=61647 RepID=UPI002914F105|nr:packaged DNA stabilization gp4 family protein [Pluralibacter gergoviae]MDU4001440.1 packaged DNA stabilization gp4 family protein [Pluralibacter gergoviae]